MDVPRELLYTSTHEWVRIKGNIAVVGITDYAQAQLSDLTYVELPGLNDEVSAEDEVGVVESVKAASDIYAPVSGEIVGINEAVTENPELINNEPYGGGWLFKIRMSEPSQADELLSAEAYEETIPEEE